MRAGGPPSQRGFAYLLLLLTIALLGIASAAAVTLGAQMGRRDAEQQLLAIGAEFRQALRSYAGLPPVAVLPPGGAPPPATPGARGPKTLQELLKDPRVPGIRRHLRQVYADPLTGKSEWGVVTDSQGFIVGIHSLAEGTPIKQDGFDPVQLGFAQARSYRDWVFGLPGAAMVRRPADAPVR